jgi:hypothetical protein
MVNMSALRERARAASIHLLISGVVAALAAAVVFLIWYRYPLNAAVGANELFVLILAVDVVLGPLLTFAVFNKAKRSLRFDLAVIGVVQLAALGYGLHTMFVGKPAYLTFNEDRFFIARVGDIDRSWYDRPSTHSEFSASDLLFAPGYAAVKWPDDMAARNDLLFSDSSARVDAYMPIADAASEIRRVAKPLDQVGEFNRGRLDEVGRLKGEWASRGVASLGFIPLRAPKEDMSVLIDTQTGRVLDVVRLKPWK